MPGKKQNTNQNHLDNNNNNLLYNVSLDIIRVNFYFLKRFDKKKFLLKTNRVQAFNLAMSLPQRHYLLPRWTIKSRSSRRL